MSGTEAITLIIAIYGAALSTALGVMQFIRGTRRIVVRCSIAIAGGFLEGPHEFVVIKAVNKRPRPVTVAAAGLRMSDGQYFTQAASRMGRQPLPIKLDVGDAVAIYFDMPEVERVMNERRPARIKLTAAFVRDAEGKVYSSCLPKLLKQEGLAK